MEKPLGNVKSLLDSFWAILKGSWKATEKCPNKAYIHWANVPIDFV
jgi:hypothetical protein